MADNTKLCSPVNWLIVYPVTSTGSTGTTYIDALGNSGASPIGLYNFFEPMLDKPIAIHQLVNQNITLEDTVYGTWNK